MIDTGPGSSMRREIYEIPEALRRLLTASKTWPQRRLPTAVALAAHGSSLHAGLIVQRQLARRGRALRVGSPQLLIPVPNEQLIAVSQSGRTQSVLDWCGDRDVLLITNHPEQVPQRPVLALEAGPERAVCATKTVVSTIVALDLYLTTDRNQRAARWDRFIAQLDASLPDLHRSAASLACQLHRYGDRPLWIVAGAELAGTGREAALKIVESCGRVCTFLEAEDGLHGPVRGVAADTVVLLAGPMPERIRKRWHAASEFVVDVALSADFEDELLAAVAALVQMQLLAYEFALLGGSDPDQPSALSKVTNP